MQDVKKLIALHYNAEVFHVKKYNAGAGSNTYYIDTSIGKYILKNVIINDINNPQNELKLCAFLRVKGIPVSEFIPDIDGDFLWHNGNDIYHMQKFIAGKNYAMHSAPDWLMTESSRMLGKIHSVLKDYESLPIGIGENFFKYMTPQTAMQSYQKSLDYAIENHHRAFINDLRYRMELMRRLSIPEIDLSKLTRSNTHGDYFISQLICRDQNISAVIDWTSACIHPAVWEILRSFIYGNPKCGDGSIAIPEFVEYAKNYLDFAPLTKYDLEMMPYVFYYQICVCDYYNQYFQSDANNRHIFLEQAILFPIENPQKKLSKRKASIKNRQEPEKEKETGEKA